MNVLSAAILATCLCSGKMPGLHEPIAFELDGLETNWKHNLSTKSVTFILVYQHFELAEFALSMSQLIQVKASASWLFIFRAVLETWTQEAAMCPPSVSVPSECCLEDERTKLGTRFNGHLAYITNYVLPFTMHKSAYHIDRK